MYLHALQPFFERAGRGVGGKGSLLLAAVSATGSCVDGCIRSGHHNHARMEKAKSRSAGDICGELGGFAGTNDTNR